MSNEVTIKLKAPFTWVNNLSRGPDKTCAVYGAKGIIKKFNLGGIIFSVSRFIAENDDACTDISENKNCGVWFFSYNQIEPINIKPIQI